MHYFGPGVYCGSNQKRENRCHANPIGIVGIRVDHNWLVVGPVLGNKKIEFIYNNNTPNVSHTKKCHPALDAGPRCIYVFVQTHKRLFYSLDSGSAAGMTRKREMAELATNY